MKIQLILMLSLVLNIVDAQIPGLRIIKSEDLNYKRNSLFTDKAFICEYNGNTYFSDILRDTDQSPFVLTLIKFDTLLKIQKEVSINFEKNENIATVGFRHNGEKELTYIYYSESRDFKNSGLYFQSIDLETMAFSGARTKLADVKMDLWKWKVSWVQSPGKKYAFICLSDEIASCQVLLDNRNKVMFNTQNNLNNYEFQLNDHGTVIGVFMSEYTKSSYSRNIKRIGVDGRMTEMDFNPGFSLLTFRFYMIGYYDIHTTYSVENTKHTYKFKLMGDSLYVACIRYCGKSVGENQTLNVSNGLYTGILDVNTGIKPVNENLRDFSGDLCDYIIKGIYTFDKGTTQQRISEWNELNKCKENSIPEVFIEDLIVGKSGGVSVIGSVFSNSEENALDEKLINEVGKFRYRSINFLYLKLEDTGALNERPGIFSIVNTTDYYEIYKLNFCFYEDRNSLRILYPNTIGRIKTGDLAANTKDFPEFHSNVLEKFKYLRGYFTNETLGTGYYFISSKNLNSTKFNIYRIVQN